jgi:hypothetical protein
MAYKMHSSQHVENSMLKYTTVDFFWIRLCLNSYRAEPDLYFPGRTCFDII